MTADRDTLIKLIVPHLSGGPVGSVGHMAAWWFAAQIADAILAAGWTPPNNCDHDYRWQGDFAQCIKCDRLTYAGEDDNA